MNTLWIFSWRVSHAVVSGTYPTVAVSQAWSKRLSRLAEYDDVFREAPLFSLASGPPKLKPTTVCYERGYYEHGLLWTKSAINGSVMNMICNEWVCYELVCYELVCFQMWSVMNVVCYERVCYEHGLLWRRSVMNGSVCCEHGLLWTWSVINGSAMNRSVTKVVCFEWSVLSGLFWVVCCEWSVMNRSALKGNR